MTVFRNICFSAALICGSMSVLGWGQKGHDVTAYIAEQHMSPSARAAAEQLLDGKSIVYYSNWLDNASHTPEYAYSKTWHYKNIDADETYYRAPINDKGDVVTAINAQSLILQDTTRSKEDRSLALKIIVHLVGDIHQPMHMGHRSDLGGNKHVIKYFNSPSNLHKIWDSNVLEAGHKWSYTEWQQQIDRADHATEDEYTSSMRPEDWGLETYQIAKEIYETTPQNTNVEYNYIAKWTPVIEQQLLKGGLRLANILNTILGTSADSCQDINTIAVSEVK